MEKKGREVSFFLSSRRDRERRAKNKPQVQVWERTFGRANGGEKPAAAHGYKNERKKRAPALPLLLKLQKKEKRKKNFSPHQRALDARQRVGRASAGRRVRGLGGAGRHGGLGGLIQRELDRVGPVVGAREQPVGVAPCEERGEGHIVGGVW